MKYIPKKITEDILHKIYTEKGVIIGIWLVLFALEVRFTDTGFPAISYLMLEEVASYIWANNSLIKNLTSFEDDAEIPLLNVLM